MDTKNLGGRPRIFESPEQLEGFFFDYLKYCEARQDMANIAGFIVFMYREKGLKMSRESYYAYKNYDGYSNTIKMIDESLENAVLNCKYQKDLLKIAYLNNKCGYKNINENINTNVNTDISNMSEEEKDKEIERLKKMFG